MRFSLVGFLIGAVCALVFYIVATALVAFNRSDLLFGLIAFMLWAGLTFAWPGRAP